MPKRSGYAIALGLHAPPSPATNRNLDRPDRAVTPRNAAEGFYFQLETFLDNWRRTGMPEDVVRDALERDLGFQVRVPLGESRLRVFRAAAASIVPGDPFRVGRERAAGQSMQSVP